MRIGRTSIKRRKQFNFTSDFKGTFLDGSNEALWNHVSSSTGFKTTESRNHCTVLEIASQNVLIGIVFLQRQSGGLTTRIVLVVTGLKLKLMKLYSWRENTNVVDCRSKCGRLVAPKVNLTRASSYLFLTGTAAQVPVIKQYIKPGSAIYSDSCRAYNKLEEEGCTRCSINRQENLADPKNPNIHTQNIERPWLDFKQWTKQPG